MKNGRNPKLVFSLLAAAALTVTACQVKKKSAPSTDTATTESTTTNSGGSGDPGSIAALPTALGVRNFDQVNATMESVTGVMGNNTVIQRFQALKLQLPADNDIKAFSFSAQGAITVLAAEYCNALVMNGAYATQLAAATGGFNVGAVPSTAFTATSSASLAQALIVKFWGSGYANNANANAAEQAVITLLGSLTSGQANTATTTKNAVIGACTSVLASAPTSIY